METETNIFSEGLHSSVRYRNGLKYGEGKSNNLQPEEYLDRLAGCVLGFAIGDALGAPVEFLQTPKIIQGYIPSTKKGLAAGQFTDDTQHLIIGLESLIDNNGDLNLQNHADKLVQWYKSGYARSIGRTTKLAIENLLSGVDYSKSGINNINNCGSLALARLLPVSLFSSINRFDYKIIRSDIRKILSITHSHKKVENMGILMNYFIQEEMHGKSPLETIEMIISEGEFLNRNIRNSLSKIRALADSNVDPTEAIDSIGKGGFVEDVLYSAIYSALKGNDFRESVLISANGGGDTDSRTALTGALYGLYVGSLKIPLDLKKDLERKDELEQMARQIVYLRK